MQLGVYFFGKIYVFGLDRTPSNTFQPVSTLITSSKVKNISANRRSTWPNWCIICCKLLKFMYMYFKNYFFWYYFGFVLVSSSK